jgi:hypothetical protein
MAFPILFLGWFLVAFAASWPVLVYATSVADSGRVGPFDQVLRRAVWSAILALGIALLSTADLGWAL